MKEYPEFEAALSFLPALPPDDVMKLLGERQLRLELELGHITSEIEIAKKQGLPRLFTVESEFRRALLEAELGYVRRLVLRIEAGTLEGLQWWRGCTLTPPTGSLPQPRTASVPLGHRGVRGK